jgi:hypothetical protein
MCFIRTKESKLLIAKRDIIVYKVGVYADVQMFTPYFRTDYCYRRKALANQTVTFNKNLINIGLHSILSLEGYYASLIGGIRFFSNGSRTPLITVNALCDPVYIGKFIIPRDSLYMVNSHNKVVSNRLIYTGEFKYINKNENFNVKDLWKEN